jgi:RNA polymerase sigma factor (sigma-70 family)
MSPEAPEPGGDEHASNEREGNERESYDDAFPRLWMRAYRVSFRMVRSREDAEDVAMDTMARALRDWNRLGPTPDPWVVRVATNLSIDLWRRAKRRRNHDLLGRLGSSEYQSEDGMVLRQALFRLPKRQREVVAMRYFLDMTEQDIASSLGCSPGTVKQHASRGLASLRRELKDFDAGDLTDA